MNSFLSISIYSRLALDGKIANEDHNFLQQKSFEFVARDMDTLSFLLKCISLILTSISSEIVLTLVGFRSNCSGISSVTILL